MKLSFMANGFFFLTGLMATLTSELYNAVCRIFFKKFFFSHLIGGY